MDITQYQKDRAADLKKFKDEYDESKLEYTRLLSEAVYETDPSLQEGLVKQILELNSQLAAQVREFVGQSNGKFDPKTISDMTNDIVMYQKEYSDLQANQNREKVLHTILNKESEKLTDIRSGFNLYLALLLGGILLIVILIFITPSSPLISVQEFQSPSTSMTEMGKMVGGMTKKFLGLS